MNQPDPLTPSTSADIPRGQSPGRAAPDEWERLAQAVSVRFAPHVQAAAAAVREAEQDVVTAREELTRARQAAASRHYQSDRLVFMRASVKDEVEALSRKTTEKKVKVAYRHLIDRAVELAEGEVHGYHEDQAAIRRDQEESVEAWLETERLAIQRLEAARAMHARVHDAEHTARQALAVMVEKLNVQTG
jgi:hypothetical protein